MLAVVWLPTVASLALSFTRWDGVDIGRIQFVGIGNYQQLAGLPAFGRAIVNTGVWVVGLVGVAMPLGVGIAVALDRPLRGSAFYESAFYVPVVLSLALVGIIWQLQYGPEQGFINNALGTTRPDNLIDWLGDRRLNIWAALVAAIWRHVGYITLLYLAGLRTVDPALREAAALDGAGELTTFRRIVLPLLRPVNVIVVAVSVIEALRAFDIAWILTRGQNGLETLAVLVVNGLLAEGARIGFGSAAASILLAVSVVPVALYLRRMFGRAA